MRASRLAVLLGTVGCGVLIVGACAPLLSYDDLSAVPSLDAGDGSARVKEGGRDDGGLAQDAMVAEESSVDGAALGDAGDLCVRADTAVDAWYCEAALDPATKTPDRLWYCKGHQLQKVTTCYFGCFKAKPNFPDLCASCNLGDGDYCPSYFADFYASGGAADFKNTFVVHCAAGHPLPEPTLCDGGCVGAAGASHCP